MKGAKEPLSTTLVQALVETFGHNQQSIVFLNRRGFATLLVCADCGKPLSCPNCSVTLTYHRQRGLSLCHYCDYAVPAPGTCPDCHGTILNELGIGTEKLEQRLKELLPSALVLRADSDTTSGRGSHERLFSQMSNGTADVLVGTQMIAKGHDFPGVTFVGVINAESGLGMPDFRAAERTFQLLSQVIGRTGRGESAGRVVIQAYDPLHYAIHAAAEHDAAGFYRDELLYRQEIGYPPYTFLAALAVTGLGEQAVVEQAEETARFLIRLKQELRLRVEILGPAPAPIYRLRNRFRCQILLKATQRSDLRHLIVSWRQQSRPSSTVRITVDIDPVDLM
jgi:primosomal protein N' (replication factor Y)